MCKEVKLKVLPTGKLDDERGQKVREKIEERWNRGGTGEMLRENDGMENKWRQGQVDEGE